MELALKVTNKADGRRGKVGSSRIALTDRDRQLLEHLFRFRLLARDQIMSLSLFHSLTRANTRLGALTTAGLLSRKQLPILPGHGGAQALYHLGREATGILPRDATAILAQVRQVARWDIRQVEHVLAANQVVVDFATALSTIPDCQLLSFQTEPELRQAFMEMALVPDGWISWLEAGIRFNCFIEVDLGTEGLTQWRQKVLEYHRYAESGQHIERFSFRSFRVLVLARSTTRLENLRLASQHAGRWFLFTNIGGYGSVLDSVWQPAAGGAPIKLSEAR